MTLGTAVVSVILVAIIIAIVRKLAKGVKQGKSLDCAFCSEGCSHDHQSCGHTAEHAHGGCSCGCSSQMLENLEASMGSNSQPLSQAPQEKKQ